MGGTDTWKIGLVKHIDDKIAHGDHVIPSAGGSEIELVQASEHDVPTECLNFLLVDMLARFFVYYAGGKTKVDKVDSTFFENIGVFVNIIGTWQLVISLNHEVVKLKIVEYQSDFVDAL